MAKLITLVDTFSATLDGTIWTASGSPAPSTGSGVLNVAGTSGNSNVTSAVSYDATASEVSVQVTQLANNGSTNNNTELVVKSGEANTDCRIQYKQSDNKIHCRRQISGSDPAEFTITYDAVNHVYWRIRENAGQVFWETSPTGVAGSFTALRTELTSSVVTSLGAGYLGTVTVALAVDNAVVTGAKFDNVNNLPAGGGGGGVGGNAKVGSLQDDFNQPLGSNWTLTNSATAGTGSVVVGSDSDIETVATWDLTSSVALVQVVRVSTGANTQTNLVVDNPLTAGTNLRINHDSADGNLYFESQVGFADGGRTHVVYNATTHAWWKIEQVAGSGNVTFSTSPDSVTWTVQRTVATPSWAGNINIFLSVDGTATLSANFDNFNKPTTALQLNPKIATLIDTFDGTAVDANWVASGNVVINNDLEVTPAGTTAIGLNSVNAYDLTSSIFILGKVTASQTVGDETLVQLNHVGGNERLAFNLSNGTITAGLYVGGAGVDVTSTPADLTKTYGLRITEAAGTVSFDCTLDGTFTDFPTLNTVTTSSWMSNVKVFLGADNTNTGGTGGGGGGGSSSFTPNTAGITGGQTVSVDFRTASRLFSAEPLDAFSIGSCIGGVGDGITLTDTTYQNLLKALGPITWRVAGCQWTSATPKLRQGGMSVAQAVSVVKGVLGGTLYPLVLMTDNSDNDNAFSSADAAAAVNFFRPGGAGAAYGPIKRLGIGNEPCCGNGLWMKSAHDYAALFESCYQAVHNIDATIALTGPNVGCISCSDDKGNLPSFNNYNDQFVADSTSSHISGLSFHAYNGRDVGTAATEYATEIARLRSAFPGKTYGCEEFNWAPDTSQGSGPFYNWQNLVFMTNVIGNVLKASGHAYQFVDSGAMGLVATGANNNQPPKYSRLPSYWALGAWTGLAGIFRDTRGGYMMPSTGSGNVEIFAVDNGRIILTNRDTTTDHAVTIGMGGTTTGKYNAFQSVRSDTAQTTPYNEIVTQGTYTGGIIPSINLPRGTVTCIELFA